jgi:hypothetical protein
MGIRGKRLKSFASFVGGELKTPASKFPRPEAELILRRAREDGVAGANSYWRSFDALRIVQD